MRGPITQCVHVCCSFTPPGHPAPKPHSTSPSHTPTTPAVCVFVCVHTRVCVCVSLLACLLRDNFCLNATAACQPSLGCASHPHTRFAVLCRHADLHVCVTIVHIHQAFPSPLPLSRSIPRSSHVRIILPGTFDDYPSHLSAGVLPLAFWSDLSCFRLNFATKSHTCTRGRWPVVFRVTPAASAMR